MILGSRTSTRLPIFILLFNIRGFTHLISMCLHFALFYSAATQSLDTEVAPSMGVIDKVPLLNPVAESISDCHNDLFTGAESRKCWQISDAPFRYDRVQTSFYTHATVQCLVPAGV
jgi:hypothetical protein